MPLILSIARSRIAWRRYLVFALSTLRFLFRDRYCELAHYVPCHRTLPADFRAYAKRTSTAHLSRIFPVLRNIRRGSRASFISFRFIRKRAYCQSCGRKSGLFLFYKASLASFVHSLKPLNSIVVHTGMRFECDSCIRRNRDAGDRVVSREEYRIINIPRIMSSLREAMPKRYSRRDVPSRGKREEIRSLSFVAFYNAR